MSLNVTVTPGHTFTDSETVTTAKMNAAATPTVAVTGSIDASEIGTGAVDTDQLAAGAVTPAKMGEATLTPEATGGVTMAPSTYNKKGVILASGGINNTPAGQFEELWAGQPNSFLIGHATELDGTWTGDWSVRSKTLHSNSSVYVSQQETSANTFTLSLKEDAITKSMLQAGSVGNTQLANYSVTIDKIVPGGGTAAATGNLGIAETDSTFWGGIIDFDPADASTSTKYNGTAKVLKPSGKNQVLYGSAEGQRLKFDHHPCIPRAWCHVVQSGGTISFDSAHSGGLDSSNFTIIAGSGIAANGVSLTSTCGVYTIRFETGVAAQNDSIKVIGLGHASGDTTYFPAAGTSATANTDTVDANLDISVKFWGSPYPTMTLDRQPVRFTLYFY